MFYTHTHTRARTMLSLPSFYTLTHTHTLYMCLCMPRLLSINRLVSRYRDCTPPTHSSSSRHTRTLVAKSFLRLSRPKVFTRNPGTKLHEERERARGESPFYSKKPKQLKRKTRAKYKMRTRVISEMLTRVRWCVFAFVYAKTF